IMTAKKVLVAPLHGPQIGGFVVLCERMPVLSGVSFRPLRLRHLPVRADQNAGQPARCIVGQTLSNVAYLLRTVNSEKFSQKIEDDFPACAGVVGNDKTIVRPHPEAIGAASGISIR